MKNTSKLASGNLVRAENTRIISESHILNTVRANKIALSAYDDKRYNLSDGISTLPYGHYRTVNASIFPDSNQDDDDDDDDSERNVSLLLSKLQQHIESVHQNFNNLCRYCRLGFCELKDFKDHLQSEHGLPVLDQQLTSLNNPSTSITQASDIDNFPAAIEVHESATKNTLMTFIIPNQNVEHDLIEFMTLKKMRFKV